MTFRNGLAASAAIVSMQLIHTTSMAATPVVEGKGNEAVAKAADGKMVAESVLHLFAGGSDGAQPHAQLIQDTDGSFYGTTLYGGTNSAGTVFKITPDGSEKVLHSFGGTDGSAPLAGLIRGSDGSFYGTTSAGGSAGFGTVYKISAGGNESIFYSFTNGLDGAKPESSLIVGQDGNFYGTTDIGAPDNYLGTVYEVTATGIESVLYTFDSPSTSGAQPDAAVIQAADGNFYGTTNGLQGAVYEVTPGGVETALHIFNGGSGNGDGISPVSALIQADDGSFYGTTQFGGANNLGTVFKVSPSGEESVLYSFGSSAADGAEPQAALIQAADGNLYGTTSAGGANNFGSVFEITREGAETVLYSFAGGTDGAAPVASLIQASDGNLYGTTSGFTGLSGGFSYGTVFKIALPVTATPAFSLPSGSYTSEQSVELSDSVSGAVIYYTTDGSAPTVRSNKYSGAITVSSTQTINAMAVGSGDAPSMVASATYSIVPPAATPAFSVKAGSYTSAQSVALSDGTNGASIYYTIDGSTPTTRSTRYTGPITVSSSETIKAIAVATGYSSSAVASASYTITSSGGSGGGAFGPGLLAALSGLAFLRRSRNGSSVGNQA